MVFSSGEVLSSTHQCSPQAECAARRKIAKLGDKKKEDICLSFTCCFTHPVSSSTTPRHKPPQSPRASHSPHVSPVIVRPQFSVGGRFWRPATVTLSYLTSVNLYLVWFPRLLFTTHGSGSDSNPVSAVAPLKGYFGILVLKPFIYFPRVR